jgi:hypothetical protein
VKAANGWSSWSSRPLDRVCGSLANATSSKNADTYWEDRRDETSRYLLSTAERNVLDTALRWHLARGDGVRQSLVI